MNKSDKSKQLKVIHETLQKSLPQIQAALPNHLNSERICRVALTELRKNPFLLECSPISFISVVMQASQLGLEIGADLGHAYIVPFKNKKGVPECQFIIGYRGMIELSMRSGKVISLNAQPVYENDIFEFEYGINEKLRHVPTFKEDTGEFIGAYAIAHLEKGGYQFKFVPANKINKIKDIQLSKFKQGWQKNKSPWCTSFDEMASKTAVRRLFKYLPISVEMSRAVTIDEKSERGELDDMEFDIPTEKLKRINVKQLNENKMEETFSDIKDESERENELEIELDRRDAEEEEEKSPQKFTKIEIQSDDKTPPEFTKEEFVGDEERKVPF